MKRFVGYKKDGMVSVCRAKPEYRGKGMCKHYDHVELDSKDIPNFIAVHNERFFNDRAFAMEMRRTNIPEKVTADKIQTFKNGPSISKEELTEGASKIAEHVSAHDWSIISEFQDAYYKRLSDEEIAQGYEDAADNIAEFLEGDDPVAERLRNFLGKKVDLWELSNIMVYNVRAMMSSEKWRGGRNSSIPRIVFTTLNNDMTKERYIASILFFGGRCCYCNTVLRKNPPPSSQASGEHLTPVSPDNPDAIHGGTRYGNMVLACVSCNRERKNQDLVEWLQETKRVKNKDKKFVLGRINAFREFALYSEYSRAENDRILLKATQLQSYVETERDPKTGQYKEGADARITDRIKIALYDLRYDGDDENDTDDEN